MKKQIKDCSIEELENNVDNPKILEMIGLFALFSNNPPETFNEMYSLICKMKELLEEEIELEDN
jgi:hypothetical protein